MPAPSAMSRALRLQFSLRALLLFMAVVGIAIAIYRWPWAETTEETRGQPRLLMEEQGSGYDVFLKKSGGWECEWHHSQPYYNPFDRNISYRVATTYRRGWTGKPERHGRQQVWLLSPPPIMWSGNWPTRSPAGQPWLLREKYYVDNDLRRVNAYSGDKITFSEGRLNGLPHGDHRNTDSTERSAGRYQHGKRIGIWHTSYAMTYHQNSERIEVEESYHNGRLHGNWTWRTPGGRVLQSGRYDLGQLVEWNGQPKEEALEKLLEQCDLPKESQQQLHARSAGIKFKQEPVRDKLLSWHLELPDVPARSLIFADEKNSTTRWHPLSIHDLALSPAEPPIQAVLEYALPYSHTLVVRSNRLFLVKISVAELDR